MVPEFNLNQDTISCSYRCCSWLMTASLLSTLVAVTSDWLTHLFCALLEVMLQWHIISCC